MKQHAKLINLFDRSASSEGFPSNKEPRIKYPEKENPLFHYSDYFSEAIEKVYEPQIHTMIFSHRITPFESVSTLTIHPSNVYEDNDEYDDEEESAILNAILSTLEKADIKFESIVDQIDVTLDKIKELKNA